MAIACDYGAGALAPLLRNEGAAIYPIDCAGNLHTSVVELLVRGRVGGVLVLPCHVRDCRNREGPRWLAERVYAGREAELQTRVDRRRVEVVHAGARDARIVRAAVDRIRRKVEALDRPPADGWGELELICERPAVPPRQRKPR